MVAKLDGTSGLLQQYDYQVSTTGFSYTFAAGTTVLVMNPAGTLATGTITMPAAPADGMTISFSSTQTITALTVNANTGQSIVGAPTVLPANQAGGYVYRLSNTTWYPFESVPTNVPVAPAGGSIITRGTAVTLTTQTSVDFTSIPSWVKRITVMLQGVSLSSTASIIVQLGTGSTTYTTTGYVGGGVRFGATTLGAAPFTTGFGLNNAFAAALIGANITITNVTGNTWSASGTGGTDTTGSLVLVTGGYIALAAALTAVRITTNSTDTFDAGSINILYE